MASLPGIILQLEQIIPSQGSIEKMYGLMLYGAVRKINPDVIVELGTGSGYSTAWMLLGLEENERGHLYSIDVMPSDNPIWRKVNLSESHLTYLSNDPIETIKHKIPNEIDFIFHDAGHSWAEVRNDLAWLIPRLKVNGSIVIHDVRYSANMGEELLKFFDSKTSTWKYEQIEEGCGVGIATRIKEDEDKTCKVELSGLTIQKDSDLSQDKMEKTISRISRKSKWQGVKRSQKTKKSVSIRVKKQKDYALNGSSPHEVVA